MKKIKHERFHVTGVQYYQGCFTDELGTYNYDYDEKSSELKESYDVGDKIYQYDFFNLKAELIPEPENEHDPNAVKVMVNDIQVGHIKKGSCSRVKNLIKSPDFAGIDVEIYGGKYKMIVENDEGRTRVVSDERPYCVDIDILIKEYDEPDPDEPAADLPDKEPKRPIIREDIACEPDLKTKLNDRMRLLITATVIVIIIIIVACII